MIPSLPATQSFAISVKPVILPAGSALASMVEQRSNMVQHYQSGCPVLLAFLGFSGITLWGTEAMVLPPSLRARMISENVQMPF